MELPAASPSFFQKKKSKEQKKEKEK